MNKDRYLIGDVANLMGMSRDTLRHYEKRGLVTAKKPKTATATIQKQTFPDLSVSFTRENGYRTG